MPREWLRPGASGLLLLAGLGLDRAAAQTPERATGRIVGRVVAEVTERPLGGVEVRLGETGRTTTTSADGEFAFDSVSTGVVSLQASALGFRPQVHGDIRVSAAGPTMVTIRLAPQALDVEGIVVRPSAFASPSEAPTSRHRVRAEEVRRTPGAQEDVVRAISTLPGVTPTPIHNNALVVRGGAPFENLFVVDGLPVPNINHFGAQGSSGGQAALINVDFVDQVDFSTAPTSSSFGDHVGAVTELRLRPGSEAEHAAELNFAITGFGAVAEGPVGEGSYLVGLRRSYLDLVYRWAGEPFYTQYWDANVKVVQELGSRDRLSWTFVGARDDFGLRVETADDAYDAALLATNDDQYFSSLTWSHVTERSRLSLTAGRISHSFDVVENDTLATPIFTNRSDEVESSLRATYVRSFDHGSLVEVGAALGRHSPMRYDVALPGELRPDAEGAPRPLDLDRSISRWHAGAHAQATLRWTGRLSSTIGARVDRFGAARGAVRAAPRLSATVELGAGTSLNAALGRSWQAPSFIWLMGDPTNHERLEPIRADQAVLGLQHLAGAETKLQVEAYFKRYGDYPARLWHPEAVVAPATLGGATTDTPFALEPLASAGEGRAYGVELLAQKRLGSVPVYGLATLSLGRSEFTALDGVRRRGSYDAPVVANVALGWRPTPDWELGLRFRAASGAPTTPFVDSGPLAGRLDLDRFNQGRRMPTFHSLDVRIDRRWILGGVQLTTYVDIQDVYNRDNAIGREWDWRDGGARLERAIGFLPSLGLNVQF